MTEVQSPLDFFKVSFECMQNKHDATELVDE